MGIQIPMFLVNQTGPEWDKFVKQAQRAGAELSDIGQIGNEVFDNLVNRKIRESRIEVDKLADSFAKSDTSLRGMVKTANALNITPRGFEMTAFRVSGLIESLGAAAVPLGGVAAVIGGITAAIGELESRGDPSVHQMNESTKALGRSWHDLLYEIGKTGTVQTVVSGIAGSLDVIATSTNTASHAFSVGIPLMKEYFYTLTNQIEKADAARREMFAASAAADVSRASMFDPKAMADSRLMASGALGKIRESEESKRRTGEFAKLTDKDEIEAKIAKAQQFLTKTSMTGAAGRPDAVAKQIKDAEETVRAGRERMLAIDMEAEKLSERSKKLEEDRAILAKDPTPFRMAKDVTKEIEEQQKILGDVTRKLDERKGAEEQIRRLLKEETDLKREEARQEQEIARFKEHQLDVQRKQLEHARQEGLQIAKHNAMLRERHALQKENEARKLVQEQLGGDAGIKNMMEQLDPKRVRRQIGDGRAQNAANMIGEQQKKALARFDDKWAYVDDIEPHRRGEFEKDRARARDALMKQQQREMIREKQKARASGMRDFNQGRVSTDEVQEAQGRVLSDSVDLGTKMGKISKAQGDRIKDAIEAQKRQADLLDEVVRDLTNLRRVTNLRDEALRKATENLARGKLALTGG